MLVLMRSAPLSAPKRGFIRRPAGPGSRESLAATAQQQHPDWTSGLMRSARSLMDALTAPARAAALHLSYLHMQSY